MINYTNRGTAYKLISSNGPEIILVHGLGMNHQMWNWQIEELSKKDVLMSEIGTQIRAVTHLDIDDTDIESAIKAINQVVNT